MLVVGGLHAHTHAHAHTRTCPRAHAHTPTLIYALSRIHTRSTHTRKHTHKHTRSHTRSHTCKHTRKHTRKRARTHENVRAHTQTRTHSETCAALRIIGQVAMCLGDCRSGAEVAPVLSRAASLLGLPVSHAEGPQMLQYEPGQYYRVHHDMLSGSAEVGPGPRIFSLLLYLSDVEEVCARRSDPTGTHRIPLLSPLRSHRTPLRPPLRSHRAPLCSDRGARPTFQIWVSLYRQSVDEPCYGHPHLTPPLCPRISERDTSRFP